jgi:hypothetical protein
MALTRVCPRCSTLAQTDAPTCPVCGASYRRRSPVPALAAVLLVHAALVVGGVVLALAILGREVDRRVDDSVRQVRTEIRDEVDAVVVDVRRQLRRELDRRLPANGVTGP